MVIINKIPYRTENLNEIINNMKNMGKIIKEVNNDINDIRIQWGNRRIEIITEEIRKNIKLGDTKMVWKRINQLKNNKTRPFEKIILKKGDNSLTKNDDEVLNEMQDYNKLNFYQEKEEIEKK